MKKRTRGWLPGALVLTSVLVLGTTTGCDDGGGDGLDPTDTSMLRVLHLSPDAPSVEVWANSTTLAVESLEFPDGTSYLELDSGTYTFSISPEGSGAGASVLDIEDLALEADSSCTAVAFGPLDSIQALDLMDDYGGLADGDLRVRAVHTASGVGEVDIWNIPETGDPSILYENVGYGVAGDYMDLPAGAYTLGIDVDDDASPDVIYELPELPAGTVANVFAVSDASDAVFLQAQFADGSTVRIDPTL